MEIDLSPQNIEDLTKFIEQNKKVNFVIFDLNSQANVDKLNFSNLKKKEQLLPLIKAYQRILRVLPDKNKAPALALLKEGIHSALQIAAMTRKDFLGKCSLLFGDDCELAGKIYRNALNKKSLLLVQHMNALQNNEPHISAARFK